MDFFPRLKKTIIEWGIKHPVTVEGKFIGHAAPLWFNASPGGFLGQAIASFIVFFTYIMVYVFAVQPVPECETVKRILIIIQIVFLGLDWLFDARLFLVRVASDIQWSRYLVKTSSNCCSMVLLSVISILLGGIIPASTSNTTCMNDISTNPENIVNITLSLSLLTLSFFKLVLVIYLYRMYYRTHRYLAYRTHVLDIENA